MLNTCASCEYCIEADKMGFKKCVNSESPYADRIVAYNEHVCKLYQPMDTHRLKETHPDWEGEFRKSEDRNRLLEEENKELKFLIRSLARILTEE